MALSKEEREYGNRILWFHWHDPMNCIPITGLKAAPPEGEFYDIEIKVDPPKIEGEGDAA